MGGRLFPGPNGFEIGERGWSLRGWTTEEVIGLNGAKGAREGGGLGAAGAPPFPGITYGSGLGFKSVSAKIFSITKETGAVMMILFGILSTLFTLALGLELGLGLGLGILSYNSSPYPYPLHNDLGVSPYKQDTLPW